MKKRKKKSNNRKVLYLVMIVFLIILFFVLGIVSINKILVNNNLDNKLDNTTIDKTIENNKADDECCLNDIGVEDGYYEEEVILEEGFDGYYIGYFNGSFYLGRNGKKVSELLENPVQIYKDPTDSNSKFIGVGYLDGEYNFTNLYGVSNNIVVGSSGSIDNVYVSMIYNPDTGSYKIYNGFLNDMMITNSNGKKYYFLSVINSNGERTANAVIDGDSLLPVTDIDSYIVYGDWIQNVYEETLQNYSNKYIVAQDRKTGKYGIIDFNGNIIVDFLYEDLMIVYDQNILAKMNGKYGAIDLNGNIVIDFKYDGIDCFNDYYAVVLNGKMGVIDKNKQEIVPIYIDVYQYTGFNFRNVESNGFSVVKGYLEDDKKMIVNYLDKTIIDDESMYGHAVRYLSILENGKYVIED